MGFLRAALAAGRLPARKAMNMMTRVIMAQFRTVNSVILRVGKSARKPPG